MLIVLVSVLAFPALSVAQEAEPTVTVSGETPDGVVVHMDVYRGPNGPADPLVLLYHQAGASAQGEYADAIIPRLQDAGFAVIAVDCRIGGDAFGGDNRTAAGLPEGVEYTYCDAYLDLYAGLDIADALELTGPRFVWGSSYTAALALRLSSEHPEKIAGVLAFSPASGEAMGECAAYNYAGALRTPAFIAWPASELQRETMQRTRVAAQASGSSVEMYTQPRGVHGSSMLHPDRAEGGTNEAWGRVMTFLRRHSR